MKPVNVDLKNSSLRNKNEIFLSSSGLSVFILFLKWLKDPKYLRNLDGN